MKDHSSDVTADEALDEVIKIYKNVSLRDLVDWLTGTDPGNPAFYLITAELNDRVTEFYEDGLDVTFCEDVQVLDGLDDLVREKYLKPGADPPLWGIVVEHPTGDRLTRPHDFADDTDLKFYLGERSLLVLVRCLGNFGAGDQNSMSGMYVKPVIAEIGRRVTALEDLMGTWRGSAAAGTGGEVAR